MSLPPPAPRSHSLVTRLLIAQVAPLAVFAFVVLAVGAWTAHRVVEGTSDRLLAGAMQTIRESVTVESGRVTVDVAPWSLALLDGPERDAVFYSVRERERLITGYDELPNLEGAVADRPVFADLTVRGVPVRMAQQTLTIPGRAAPIVVSVAQSLDSRRASLRELYRSMLLLPGLLVVVAALLIWPALQWGLHSLNRLIEDLSRRPAETGFAPAPADLAPREFWPVLTAFNRLLAGLEKSTSSIQRFAADASHQLRTPLSILAANLDLLAASSRHWTPTEQRLIEDSRRATSGMTRLINQLLSTARADAVGTESSADLARAVRTAYQVMRDRRLFAPPDLHLRLSIEPVVVQGSEELIAEQVLNLVDNAFQHGRAPVTIHVAATPDGGRVTVWDHGQGVDEAVVSQLTDRFFRAHPTRTQGSGLGLAIVATLATAQGAQLEIANRRARRRGLVVRLSFHAASSPKAQSG